MTPSIRPESPADHEAIRRVNRLAFGQDDEAVLVDALAPAATCGSLWLRRLTATWWATSSSAICQSSPIAAWCRALRCAVAVRPDQQRRGMGSALIRAGLAAARAAGHRIVVVLGHAEYYPRFGFSAKLAEPLSSPYSGRDSWMALELVPGALDGVEGAVQ